MKKHYVTVELDCVFYSEEDTIRTSGIEVDGSALYGADTWFE